MFLPVFLESLVTRDFQVKVESTSIPRYLTELVRSMDLEPSFILINSSIISQLIRYARCCSHYDDFRYRHKCLVDRLLSQGYKALRLEKSFKKFYGRYQDLIEKYRRSVNAMVSDSFPGQFLFNM